MHTVYSVLYWLSAVTIGLGAFGHGIPAARRLATALSTASLDPHMAGVIWIVWYFVSGCMVVFGALALWAWFAARGGASGALVVPLVIGAFYAIVGAASYLYQRDVFWLLFLVQGVLLLGATLGLRGVGTAGTIV
ncbi:MAG TPA: hypothetical protein VFD76_04765 [Gemmatimonadales bacterium]|nr:hypothetical protein [Gemmatimonadales bacterium]